MRMGTTDRIMRTGKAKAAYRKAMSMKTAKKETEKVVKVMKVKKERKEMKETKKMGKKMGKEWENEEADMEARRGSAVLRGVGGF